MIDFLISAIEYVTYLSNDKDHKNEEIAEMEKKLKALQIVKGYLLFVYIFHKGILMAEIKMFCRRIDRWLKYILIFFCWLFNITVLDIFEIIASLFNRD